MEYMQHIEKAIIYIERNLDQDISVAAVAGSAAYSYFHFHRMFEAVTGESIGGYIRSRRLSKAAEELLYTDKRIIDIAVSLRFDSHEAFGRAFKRMFHVTPSQYRKNGVDTLIGRKGPLDILAITHRQNISLEPEIISLPPMLLVGMRFPVSIESNNTAEQWAELMKRLPEIDDPVKPMNQYSFYEAHENCSYDALAAQVTTTAFIGIEVSATASLPSGMISKTFSGGKYAHFVHVGGIASLIDTYRYIWGTWIPYNKIKLAAGDDIERRADYFREDDENAKTDLFLPIL